MSEPTQEFLEKSRILELEKEVIELRHSYKMQEIKLQREISHTEHLERMRELAVKNRNITRSFERYQNPEHSREEKKDGK